MDKIQILVLTSGTIIIIFFAVYSYSGPTVISQKTGTNVEPVKTTDSSKISTNKQNTSLNVGISPSTINSKNKVMQNKYENKDMPENYYSINFPSNYVVKHGEKPGSLISDVTNAIFTVNLQDIPDDSTMDLYVLTNIEPSLNASHSNYQRTYFEKFDLNNNKALELSYAFENLTKPIKSIKTFIEGQDEAAVITFTSPSKEYLNYNSTVNDVLNSFRWL